MLERRTHRNIEWIDLAPPSSEDVRVLMKEFGVHPLIADELLTPSVRQKTERYGDFLYLVLHIPSYSASRAHVEQEIDFVVGKRSVITAHYEEIENLRAFARAFETNALLDQSPLGSHGGHLLYLMVQRLYRGLHDELEYIRTELTRIEERIFDGKEKEMVTEISRTSRIILDFRRTLAPHKEMLASLEVAGSRLFGQEFAFYARLLQSEYLKVENGLAELKDSILELRETNNSLLSTKQNEIMKVLTIMAFVTFPLTLVSSIFGMNTNYLPIVGLRGDFWYVIGIMLVLGASFFSYFKYKRWL